MNTFVRLVRLDELHGSYVRYYSVQIEGEDVSLFEDFLNRMEEKGGQDEEVMNELVRLLLWIEVIGNEIRRPLQREFFRHEGRISDAKALPPPRGKAKGHARSKAQREPGFNAQELDTGRLRLYCMAANDHVVILFNGDLKTTGIQDANDCPIVRPFFQQANLLTRLLNQAFKDQEIRWNEEFDDILFDDDLNLII